MQFLDSYGWPVERIKGRHIINFFRIMLLTSWMKTIKILMQKKNPLKSMGEATTLVPKNNGESYAKRNIDKQ